MADTLLRIIEEQFMPQPPKRLGVAVSGGGDSMALLSLLAEFARGKECEIHAISVDHGLRAEARDELRLVTDLAARLGISHHIEYWRGWDGEGNLQERARDARYDLMSSWAEANGISHIALAHTADDQAETFLMRLARGAGVNGLSAMAHRHVRHGITWLRPLLRVRRQALREYLQDRDIGWCEDPTNEDTRFERVRVREMMPLLEELGLMTDTLVHVAHTMNKAREALDWQTFLAAREMVRVVYGALAIDLRLFRTLPDEIARRLLTRAIAWISASGHPPRGAALERMLKAMRDGETSTLEGCQVSRDKGVVWIYRELNAAQNIESEVGDLWDGRWLVTGPEDDPSLVVRALGEDGLAAVQNWRDVGLPRAALLSSPSVWNGDALVAAPVADPSDEWLAELEGGKEAFFATLLSR